MCREAWPCPALDSELLSAVTPQTALFNKLRILEELKLKIRKLNECLAKKVNPETAKYCDWELE